MRDDKDKIISLLERLPAKTKDYTEYTDKDHAWESMVDLCLQEQAEYIETLIAFNRASAAELEDLRRDVRDLNRTLDSVINILVKRGIHL